jgi:hypothetical protein
MYRNQVKSTPKDVTFIDDMKLAANGYFESKTAPRVCYYDVQQWPAA